MASGVDEIGVIGVDPRIQHRDAHARARESTVVGLIGADQGNALRQDGVHRPVEVHEFNVLVAQERLDRGALRPACKSGERLVAMLQAEGASGESVENALLPLLHAGASLRPSSGQILAAQGDTHGDARGREGPLEGALEVRLEASGPRGGSGDHRPQKRQDPNESSEDWATRRRRHEPLLDSRPRASCARGAHLIRPEVIIDTTDGSAERDIAIPRPREPKHAS